MPGKSGWAVPLVAAWLSLSAPLMAQPPGMSMESGEESGLAGWIGRVEKDLDRHLSYPKPLGTAPYSEGIVHVSFLGGPDGRPSNVAIGKSSGARDLDAAAIRAVRNITTLHPLPEGVSADQKYEAAILFATQDDRETARKLAELRRRARAEVELLGLADPAGGRTVLLMSAGAP